MCVSIETFHLSCLSAPAPFLVQLLVEWGADIYIKNRISKTAMDLIRNVDMKEFLQGQYLMINANATIYSNQ